MLAMASEPDLLRDLDSEQQHADNTTSDIITRLPLEISSDIFVQCLPHPVLLRASQPPTLFLSLCRGWRAVAVATPTLWTVISDGDTSPHVLPDILDRWLPRSGNLPLSLSIHRGAAEEKISSHAGRVQTLINAHAHRVRSLDLVLGSTPSGWSVPGFCALTQLTVRGRLDSGCNVFEGLALMSAAPNLEQCTLTRLFQYNIHPPVQDIHVTTLSSLRHLNLGRPPAGTQGASFTTARVLSYFTLPALQTLAISFFDITIADLRAFLLRSTPPLRSLHMEVLSDGQELAECLRLLTPALEELNIGSLAYGEADAFVPFLETFPLEFKDFTLQCQTLNSWHYELVLEALILRRGCLRSFRLEAAVAERPSEEIAEGMRQLAEEGMKIHVGTRELKYI
ncbi:hypothetical protein FB45DRAFT_906818 [Roridomyces roridus]|uniref:F-box domain-containing protein n=1 Tax=Roridomyces roridus TaxID=1738132 RepID=A0AAD7FTE9_9AGAR|nr:hypothetical protein FB45DRAFT_906818 [Roridomyces roridus]